MVTINAEVLPQTLTIAFTEVLVMIVTPCATQWALPATE